MLYAQDLIAPGGPSAPVWAFLTGISLAVLAIISQQLKAKSDLKQMKMHSEVAQNEASKAHKSAAEAQQNTASIANGFASRVLGKLERIHETQQETDKAIRSIARSQREHLQWHLERDDRKE